MSTYLESDAVTAAKEETRKHLESRPQYASRWESQLAQALEALDGRKLSYDHRTDPLWDSYRRAYTGQGRLAMEDTLGKTTALTGGYGNSWAATAAQASYNGYLQQLTDKIPQLYALAQEEYDRQTQELNDRYEQYLQREAQDRESFQDLFDNWLKELQLLRDQQAAVEKEDYDRYQDRRQWEQKQASATEPTPEPDVPDSSGSSATPSRGYDNGSVSRENIMKIQAALGVEVDGKWGPKSREAAGGVDADTAWANYLSEYGPEGKG